MHKGLKKNVWPAVKICAGVVVSEAWHCDLAVYYPRFMQKLGYFQDYNFSPSALTTFTKNYFTCTFMFMLFNVNLP